MVQQRQPFQLWSRNRRAGRAQLQHLTHTLAHPTTPPHLRQRRHQQEHRGEQEGARLAPRQGEQPAGRGGGRAAVLGLCLGVVTGQQGIVAVGVSQEVGPGRGHRHTARRRG